MKVIAIITMDTSTSAEYCFSIPLKDLIEFWYTLNEIAEIRRKERANGK